MNIAIVKYNAGNIYSVDHALRRLGINAVVTSDKETLCEYYLFKMLFTDRTEVLREVELLKKQEMYENEFLEVLIETINNFKK